MGLNFMQTKVIIIFTYVSVEEKWELYQLFKINSILLIIPLTFTHLWGLSNNQPSLSTSDFLKFHLNSLPFSSFLLNDIFHNMLFPS
jgi:hypothetical protein